MPCHAFGSDASLSLSGEAGENLKSQGKVDFLKMVLSQLGSHLEKA